MVGAVYNNIGVLNLRRGDLSKTLDALQRAVAIAEKTGKPNLGALFNLGVTQVELGRYEAAAATFAASLATYERLGGEDSRDTAEAATFLGAVRIMQGDYTRGRPMLLRGVDGTRRSGSPSLATALSYAARLAIHDGDRARAHALLAEAAPLPATNAPLRDVAVAELLRADAGCAAARPALEKALEHAVTEDWHYVQTMALGDLAECEVELHDSHGVRAKLEAHLARLAKDGADESVLAQGRALLAKLH